MSSNKTAEIVASSWWFIWIVCWCTDSQTLNRCKKIRYDLYFLQCIKNKLLSGTEEDHATNLSLSAYILPENVLHKKEYNYFFPFIDW